MRIIRLATVDSTNLEARRLAEQGERGPLWIVSDEQTAGKGRLGREWVSNPGNFYGTLLWPTTVPPQQLPQLSFVAALAVQTTATTFAPGQQVALKWPNDCLLDGAKFCGILCEKIGHGRVAMGIGINLAHIPEGLPYAVARLADADLESVFEHLNLNLSNTLKIWNDGQGFDIIRQSWMERCPHINQPIRVDTAKGVFAGLAPDGALLLQTASGELKHIYAGDVKVEYQP